MLNRYLMNLNKIEFAVTYACTGRCKHCSEGDHAACGDMIDPAVAANAVRKIAAEYSIGTVMAFGGEPLLHPEAVFSVMNAAREMNIPKRQVITNGYFSKDEDRIDDVARLLLECGTNDLLLSVDAFHQEYIPLDIVKTFAAAAKNYGIPIRFQPAWLVGVSDKNAYNLKTRELLDSLSYLGICENEGNVIFPEGNAKKYLSEFFKGESPENPYSEDPFDVRCVSFSPNGDVLDDNVYNRDIMEIIRNYSPVKDVIL